MFESKNNGKVASLRRFSHPVRGDQPQVHGPPDVGLVVEEAAGRDGPGVGRDEHLYEKATTPQIEVISPKTKQQKKVPNVCVTQRRNRLKEHMGLFF